MLRGGDASTSGAGWEQQAQPQQQQQMQQHPNLGVLSYLEFLNEDALFHGSELLDGPTLDAVCSAAPLSVPEQIPGSKRRLVDADVSSDEDDDDGIKQEPGGASSKDNSAKRPKTEVSKAARTKACREKARREKINDRFMELARLIDPGKEPKTDKPTILADAIKYVQQITVENHQVKQLNKFLEERVAQYEKDRGQQLYQQSLMLSQQMMGGGQQGMMLPGAQHSMMQQAGLHQGPSSMLPGMTGVSCMPGMAGNLPGMNSNLGGNMAGNMASSIGNLNAGMGGSLPGTMQAMQGSLQNSMAHHSMMGQQMGMSVPNGLCFSNSGISSSNSAACLQGPIKPVGYAGPSPGLPNDSQLLPPSSSPAMGQMGGGMQPPYWLAPNLLDTAHDSLLRPPAA